VITPKAVGAGETAMNLTAGCGGAAASAAQVGSLCPVKAKTTTDKKKLTEFQKIQEADAKARAERFQTMKDLQAKIFDVQMDVTENKAKRVDRFFHKYDQYIRANAGSPDVVATLQDADSGLSAMFPPQSTAAARAPRARTAQVGGPACCCRWPGSSDAASWSTISAPGRRSRSPRPARGCRPAARGA
jgi:hypothetical protein